MCETVGIFHYALFVILGILCFCCGILTYLSSNEKGGGRDIAQFGFCLFGAFALGQYTFITLNTL